MVSSLEFAHLISLAIGQPTWTRHFQSLVSVLTISHILLLQVSLFLEGERHYSHIKGVTGPLVYPAGFVYLYTVLHQITARGQDIL